MDWSKRDTTVIRATSCSDRRPFAVTRLKAGKKSCRSAVSIQSIDNRAVSTFLTRIRMEICKQKHFCLSLDWDLAWSDRGLFATLPLTINLLNTLSIESRYQINLVLMRRFASRRTMDVKISRRGNELEIDAVPTKVSKCFHVSLVNYWFQSAVCKEPNWRL